MIVQRAIGFLRSFYVCGTLSPAEVGKWDLGFSFLMLIAPFAVLGIPGSFGRYLARFESNGQQSRFLSHTLTACLVLTGLSSAIIWVFRDAVSLYCFGDADAVGLVSILALGLPAVVFFNFATSWFSGKRLNRFVFRIQFTQTLFFALLCVVMFHFISISANSVIISYLLSCLVGMTLAAGYAFAGDAGEQEAEQSESTSAIWSKILPFAVWVWIGDALTNLFAVCDRLLLVNLHPDNGTDIQSLVGQYHTACIFPLLLMTIGGMAASTGMPYLSKDWEAGDRDAVAERMNVMLKAIGLFCITASVGILLVAPILFGQIWQDKFAMGEALLPMTLCYCSLAAMTVVAQNYFWCLEKTWVGSCFLLVGLICNFVVGVALIGPYGINGVVASTLVSHGIVLAGVLLMCKRYSLRIDIGVFVLSASILCLCLGKLVALSCLVVLGLIAVRTSLFFSDQAKAAVWARVRSLQSSMSKNAS